jgi:IclR family transcriptional regulator, acetate operon repressor
MTATETDAHPTSYPIRAVDRVCDVLDTLSNAPAGVSLSEVAEVTGLPKSSAFRYLTALEHRHYVERDGDGSSYRLGPAFRPQQTRDIERLTDLARPQLERLRDQLQETTNLGILDGTQIVHRLVAESPHMMRLAARVGERGYVHSTALGKAILAPLDPDRVRTILSAAGMPLLTPATVVDADSYLAELERTRRRGYGLDDTENQAAGRCVAVRIDGIGLPAGISVSAPADRLPRAQVAEVARQLRQVAGQLSEQMQA